MDIENFGGATCSLSGDLLKKILSYRNNFKVAVIKRGDEILVPPSLYDDGITLSEVEVLEFDEGVVAFVKKCETLEITFLTL